MLTERPPPCSNLDALAPHMRLFAVDWLGTGRSGRPRFSAKGTEEAEAFFIDSLKEWRRAEGIENGKMVLVGHSLGGCARGGRGGVGWGAVEHVLLPTWRQQWQSCACKGATPQWTPPHTHTHVAGTPGTLLPPTRSSTLSTCST